MKRDPMVSRRNRALPTGGVADPRTRPGRPDSSALQGSSGNAGWAGACWVSRECIDVTRFWTTRPPSAAPVCTDVSRVFDGLSNHETVNYSAGENVMGEVDATASSCSGRCSGSATSECSAFQRSRALPNSNEFPGHHNIHDLDTILYMTTIARDTERKLNSYGALVA